MHAADTSDGVGGVHGWSTAAAIPMLESLWWESGAMPCGPAEWVSIIGDADVWWRKRISAFRRWPKRDADAAPGCDNGVAYERGRMNSACTIHSFASERPALHLPFAAARKFWNCTFCVRLGVNTGTMRHIA